MNDCVENEEYELLQKLSSRVAKLEEELKKLKESREINEAKFSEKAQNNPYLAFLNTHFNKSL